ncbi:MAG: protein translocase subunit SecD [Coriobacteriia bacterium]|nr:protein translocase subunit SecD [Coriobacteriia bacterium]
MAKLKNVKRKFKRVRKDTRRNIWLLVLCTVLVIGSIFAFVPPQEKIKQGLDIQGGLSVVLSAKTTDGSSDVSSEDMEKSRSIIESRVNALGASEAVVSLTGANNNQILVQIPGMSDTQEALNTIGKTGKLAFARLDSFTDKDVVDKINNNKYGTNSTVSDDFGASFSTGETEHLKVKPGTYTELITGDNISNVTIGKASETSSDYAVNLTLDAAGTKAFADATKELASSKGKIVIILDDEVQSAPAVQSEITGGQVSITGGYDQDGAKAMQTVLESGSLPVSFTYEQSQVVGPTLGQDALASGVLVALIGIAIVMIYLIFFYKGLGTITTAAMLIFAVLYMGILGLLSQLGFFSLSLSGIAGIVLTIGMAADSSVLTLERFREEIRMGRTVKQASKSGVHHAIMTSIDADSVTLVSALALFFFAAATVKGFGLTLALGICCDIVMMLIFKAPLIRLLAPKVMARHPKFWDIDDSLKYSGGVEKLLNGPEEEQSILLSSIKKIKGRFIKKDINFMKFRKVFLTAAAVTMLICAGFFAFKGLNFSIEFVGGTSITFHDTGDTGIEDLRNAFHEAGINDAVIQTTSADGQEGFLVRTSTTSSEDATTMAKTVADKFGWTTENFEVTTIGPDWGAGVITASLQAFFISIILIIVYIAIRFEYKMGIMAVIALLHDIVLVVGVYCIFGREISPNTIAALLTILGYSLYDTVVVFHRINDNMKLGTERCSFLTMTNHSINQVFLRSMNTTLTSLIPVVCMLFFGGETLKDFAFAMTIGLVCGAYSSIAIACPLYSWWKTREPKNYRLMRKFGTEPQLFCFTTPEVAKKVGLEDKVSPVKEGQTKKKKKGKK